MHTPTVHIPDEAIVIEHHHASSMQTLLTYTLHMLACHGNTLLSPSQCHTLTTLLSHLPHLRPSHTSHHLAWPLPLDSLHLDATLYICLPIDPSLPGVLHILHTEPPHTETSHAHP